MQKAPYSILDKSFKTGNEKVTDELFKMFFSRACVFANSIVNNDQAAYDVVQETFIKIWKKNIEFKSIIVYKAYLYNSVKNACINYLKWELKHTVELNENLGVEESIDHMIIATEIEAEIMHHINQLPESRKKVVLLKLKGYSMEEIAEELNLSINTVKTHRKKAYKQLKEGLKDLYIFLL